MNPKIADYNYWIKQPIIYLLSLAYVWRNVHDGDSY